LLLMLDAEWHFTTACADVELLSECSYVSSHAIQPLIVVGVVNTDRNRDFTPTLCPQQAGMKFPTSGEAARFRRFLVEEAIPVIDKEFRTSSFRILAGWSLGGLFTVNSLFSSSSDFDAYLAISPSLWWDDGWTLKQMESGTLGPGPKGPKQLIITLGSVEQERNSMVARAVGGFAAYLEEQPLSGVKFEQVPIEGMGHNYSPKLAYFYGLAAIFDDLAIPAEVRDRGLAAVDDYYAALSERYRFTVRVPEDVYSELGWKLFEANEIEQAGTVFQTWLTRHPNSVLALATCGAFCKETGDGERAIDLMERAIAAEEQAQRPRHAFIQDLKRDISSIRNGS
jgi:hypothetical protein